MKSFHSEYFSHYLLSVRCPARQCKVISQNPQKRIPTFVFQTLMNKKKYLMKCLSTYAVIFLRAGGGILKK